MPDSANRQTNRIIGVSLLTAETVAQELRDRLAKELRNHAQFRSFQEVLDAARSILSEFETILAENFPAGPASCASPSPIKSL